MAGSDLYGSGSSTRLNIIGKSCPKETGMLDGGGPGERWSYHAGGEERRLKWTRPLT